MPNSMDTLLGALGPLLEAAAPADFPLMLASLERMAAKKYRAWAGSATNVVEARGLLECAAREEAIADFIEALDENSNTRLEALQGGISQAQSLYDAVLDGQDKKEQFRRQAAGELGGADFLRQFRAAHTGAIAAQYEALALGEEANATFLTVLADSM